MIAPPSLETWTRLKRIAQHYAVYTGWHAITGIDYWQKGLSAEEPLYCAVHFENGHVSYGEEAAIEYLLLMCHAAGIPEPTGQDNTIMHLMNRKHDTKNTDDKGMTISTE